MNSSDILLLNSKHQPDIKRGCNVSSIQEIARPSTSAGPRMQTSNTQFYSQPGGVADVQNVDRVNRNPSSASIPPYTSARPPTYHSQESSGGPRPASSGSGSGGRAGTHVSDPPSYHSRTSSQQAQGQVYGQQPQQYQQPQQQRPAQPAQQQRPAQQQQLAVPQQRQGFRQRTSERLRNLLRRPRDRN
ncbi:hypothetical protein KVR01_010709 [Diaporthe batatas]|uniref:uncharacterized protein n=1 Tax=Diaporthe batatas TaxID=748121 RepID=UPI001D0539A1|nr:uncharacterized protein KVR01_010709 [Diaporthe batatas]KAG8160072.1 hypothetical protein KVR01_010709 [Diaporthe batatas]